MNIKPTKRVRVRNPLIKQLIIQKFSKIELDIFFYLLAKLTKSHKDTTVYTVRADEISFFADRMYNISDFVKAIESLRDKTLVIEDDEKILIDGLLSNAVITKESGVIQIRVSPEMKPLLIKVTHDYSSVQLFSLIRLRSKYAKRLYLYFTHPDRKPKKGIVRFNATYVIDDFKRDVGLVNENDELLFKQITGFKEKVLNIAVEQISYWTDIKLQYKLHKVGKSYYYIEWDVEHNDNTHAMPEYEQPIAIDFKEETFGDDIKKIELLLKLTEEFKVGEILARKAINMIDNKMLITFLDGIRKDIEEKKVEIKTDIGAYTASRIRQQWQIEKQSGKKIYPHKLKK